MKIRISLYVKLHLPLSLRGGASQVATMHLGEIKRTGLNYIGHTEHIQVYTECSWFCLCICCHSRFKTLSSGPQLLPFLGHFVKVDVNEPSSSST